MPKACAIELTTTWRLRIKIEKMKIKELNEKPIKQLYCAAMGWHSQMNERDGDISKFDEFYDQIEGGLLRKEEQDKEMFERLVNSHFSLFRRLNQISNKEVQSEATQKALAEAREVNRYFSDKDSPRIVQS